MSDVLRTLAAVLGATYLISGITAVLAFLFAMDRKKVSKDQQHIFVAFRNIWSKQNILYACNPARVKFIFVLRFLMIFSLSALLALVACVHIYRALT